MRDLSVFVSDFEQRTLIPLPGSPAQQPFAMDETPGRRAFTTATQVAEPIADSTRLWSVVVDGVARLGVMSTTIDVADDAPRRLADSLAGVVAALLVTRGQCTDAYTTIRRSQTLTLAAEMQWDLLPPLSLDSARVSVAGLIQPAYEVGGDTFDYAINVDTLHLAVLDAMGHGLISSQLAHLASSSYRHSRRCGLNLSATYADMDEAIAARGFEIEFVTGLLATLDLDSGRLQWINAGHPAPILVRAGAVVWPLACEPTLPAGIGYVADGSISEVGELVMQPGDWLFCVTDGVIDSHRPGGPDFGEDRLVEMLADRSRAGFDAAETVRQLSHSVLDHRGMLSDDTTAFLVDFHGS